MIQDLLFVIEFLVSFCLLCLGPIRYLFLFTESVSVDPECEEELQKECGLP